MRKMFQVVQNKIPENSQVFDESCDEDVYIFDIRKCKPANANHFRHFQMKTKF